MFVCQYDNFRTIKLRMIKLGEFDCQGQRSKNDKVRQFFRERSSGAWSSGVLRAVYVGVAGVAINKQLSSNSSAPVGKSAHDV